MTHNSNIRNNAEKNYIKISDTVLVKQDLIIKYSKPFNPNLHKVMEVKGTMVMIEKNK